MFEIPAEAVQAAANAALAARIAREASSPVQGPVKECPQTAAGSTESAQTPTSRVSVPPKGAEGITEPRGADARAVIAPETRGAFGADPSQEHQPQSPPQSDLRRRYADAIDRVLELPNGWAYRGTLPDALLAVRDDELERLRSALARVDALAARLGVTDPGLQDEILTALDGLAVSEQTGGGNG